MILVINKEFRQLKKANSKAHPTLDERKNLVILNVPVLNLTELEAKV